jgi:hypothetical protein
LTFQVLDGDHTGRRFWHDLWLTPAAMPMTKRDLGKLGVTRLEQLERPLPQGIRCRVRLVVHRDDDGSERNRVRALDVIGIEPPDPFTPAGPDPGDTATPSPGAAAGEAEGDRGDAWEGNGRLSSLRGANPPAGPYGAEGDRR